jgi:hypothetical protein
MRASSPLERPDRHGRHDRHAPEGEFAPIADRIAADLDDLRADDRQRPTVFYARDTDLGWTPNSSSVDQPQRAAVSACPRGKAWMMS